MIINIFGSSHGPSVAIELLIECKKASTCTYVEVSFFDNVILTNPDTAVVNNFPRLSVGKNGGVRLNIPGLKTGAYQSNDVSEVDNGSQVNKNGIFDNIEIIIVSFTVGILLTLFMVFIGIKYCYGHKKNIESEMVNVVNSRVISMNKDTQFRSETNVTDVAL